MKKITFFALHLGYGGAEKAIVSQANLLCEKYEVEIVCFYKLYENPAFYIDSRVKILYLTNNIKPNKVELMKAIKSRDVIATAKEMIRSVKILYMKNQYMKKAISKCRSDVVISTRYAFHKFLANNSVSIRIGQEHNHHNNRKSYIQKIIRSTKHMEYFMPVSLELKEFYEIQIKNKKVQCYYIPHYLEYIPKENSSLSEKNLVSIGRLAPEKGFLDLLDVFFEVNQKNPGWKLHLIGEGDERNKIEEKIQELQLNNQVILHGFLPQEQIREILNMSSIYVMTSFTESFGLVLLEAQSFGIPCVAFSSAQGAHEIIHSNKDGFLVENRDKQQMANILVTLMNDEQMRMKMGNNAKQNSLHYSKEAVREKWFSFLDSIKEKRD